ncbi:MAG: SurA N-terminal domain-containing protein [Bdellovibrionota bacterium]
MLILRKFFSKFLTNFFYKDIKSIYFLLLAIITNFTAIIFTTNTSNAQVFLDAIIATINDTPITLSDINKKYDKNYTYNELKENINANKIIDTAILDTIVEMEAKKKRISVSEKELDNYISQIASKNSLTVNEFKNELAKQNISFKNYKEQIKNDILKTKIASNIIRNGTAVTEEEVDNYLKKVAENDLLNSKISLSQICVLKNNKSEADALRILKNITDDLKDDDFKDDDFKDVAEKYSETLGAKQGGFVGEFELNELSSEIFNAVSNLKEGETSKIIDMANTYCIFKVNSKDAAKEPTEEERKKAREKIEEERLKDDINSYFSKEIFKNYTIDKKI